MSLQKNYGWTLLCILLCPKPFPLWSMFKIYFSKTEEKIQNCQISSYFSGLVGPPKNYGTENQKTWRIDRNKTWPQFYYKCYFVNTIHKYCYTEIILVITQRFTSLPSFSHSSHQWLSFKSMHKSFYVIFIALWRKPDSDSTKQSNFFFFKEIKIETKYNTHFIWPLWNPINLNKQKLV